MGKEERESRGIEDVRAWLELTFTGN